MNADCVNVMPNSLHIAILKPDEKSGNKFTSKMFTLEFGSLAGQKLIADTMTTVFGVHR